MVGQDKILVHGQIETVSDVGHDFGLLHGVDAEFTFQILVQLNKISGITGVVHDHLNDGGNGVAVVDGRRRGSGFDGLRRGDRRWVGR